MPTAEWIGAPHLTDEQKEQWMAQVEPPPPRVSDPVDNPRQAALDAVSVMAKHALIPGPDPYPRCSCGKDFAGESEWRLHVGDALLDSLPAAGWVHSSHLPTDALIAELRDRGVLRRWVIDDAVYEELSADVQELTWDWPDLYLLASVGVSGEETQ